MIKNTKPLRTSSGFSLMEIMVASGLLGVLALAVMQMNKTMTQGQATAEANVESIEIRRQIITTLASKTACENTLKGTPLGGSVNSIKNSQNAEVFVTGRKYGSNALELQSLTVVDKGDLGSGMRDAVLEVKVKNLKKASYSHKGGKAYQVRLKVKAAGATAPIEECFDNQSEIISAASEASCASLGGTWNPSTETCALNQYVKKAGDVMTGKLQAPDIQVNNTIKSPQFCTDSNCKSINDLALSNQKCPNGQVSDGVKPDGTVKCKALQCPKNMFFAGLDSNDQVICRPYPTQNCPTNEYIAEVKPDGTVTCKPIKNTETVTCLTGQVIQSISGGQPTCVAQSRAAQQCPDGNYVAGIDASGTIICKPLTGTVAQNCASRSFTRPVYTTCSSGGYFDNNCQNIQMSATCYGTIPSGTNGSTANVNCSYPGGACTTGYAKSTMRGVTRCVSRTLTGSATGQGQLASFRCNGNSWVAI